MSAPLDGFDSFPFSSGGVEKTVYTRGAGPAVVLIHELPGLVPECVELARKLAAEGYCVYMPLLFGAPGANYGALPLLWPCVWREFNVLSARGRSPAADWLRALARRAHAERGGKGVGAIGMCFTGSFALSLMMEPELIAPVLSQPSMPLTDSSALGIPEEHWENAKKRADVPVLALRFDGDPLCRKGRFDTLRAGLGERLREVVLPGRRHSVLTIHFKDMRPEEQTRVWRELTDYLKSRLK